VVQDCEHEGPHYGLRKNLRGNDSRVIFTLKFTVSSFGTQNTDFLLEKMYTTHQQNNKTNDCFLILVIKSMTALILVVDRFKQTSMVSSAILFHVSLLANLCYWR